MSLEEKRKKLLEKKQRLEKMISAVKARENLQKRKEDTRKKILAGSWVLSEAQKSDEALKKLISGLDKFLKKEADRKLFGLEKKD